MFSKTTFIMIRNTKQSRDPRNFHAKGIRFGRVFQRNMTTNPNYLCCFFRSTTHTCSIFQVLMRFYGTSTTRDRTGPIGQSIPSRFMPLSLLYNIGNTHFSTNVNGRLKRFPNFFDPFQHKGRKNRLSITPFRVISVTQFFPRDTSRTRTRVSAIHQSSTNGFLHVSRTILRYGRDYIQPRRQKGNSKGSNIYHTFPYGSGRICQTSFLHIPMGISTKRKSVPVRTFRLGTIFFRVTMFQACSRKCILPQFLGSNSMVTARNSNSRGNSFRNIQHN